MNREAAITRAEKTSALGGRTIRPRSERFHVLTVLALTLASGGVFLVWTPEPWYLGALPLLVLAFGYLSYSNAHTRAYRRLAAAFQLSLGDHPRAVNQLAEVATARLYESFVASALCELARLARTRGDFAEAAPLAMAAYFIDTQRLAPRLSPCADFARAHAAISLAALDRLDEAEQVLVMPSPGGSAPGELQVEAARALLLFKRGRFDDAQNVLAEHRVALRNALSSSDEALLAATQVLSLLARSYREPGGEAPVLVLDARTRDAVLRILPDAATVTTAE